jgi:hypothetical protein
VKPKLKPKPKTFYLFPPIPNTAREGEHGLPHTTTAPRKKGGRFTSKFPARFPKNRNS